MKHFVLTFLCFVMSFFLCRPLADAQTTVTNNGSTAADVPFTGSTQAWNTPSGALAAGGSTANIAGITQVTLLSNVTPVTDYLQITGFNFAIPVTATVQSVTATITRQASGLSATVLGVPLLGSVSDNSLVLTGTPSASSNKASGTSWLSTSQTVAYGGDLWGLVAITPTTVNSSSFGLNYSVSLNGAAGLAGIINIALLPGAAIDNVTMTVVYNNAVTLPIKLDQWSAVHQGNANVLSWSASVTELPGQFIIERSANGTDWSDLAVVAAPLYQSSYSYTDNAPFAGGPAYYRLRLHTAGEADSWSSVQAISTQSLRPVVSLYPNPFTDMINITSPQSFSKLVLKNLSGQTLYAKEYSGTGVSNAQIPASNLPGGLYFVQVDGATYKLIKN